ncbi:peptidoglycan-binding protein [Thalassorhabdus alkalitolerans]|uniref:Peptidoglycan-binding protein n=1 Tax=Thalassorhabdus alkalitolerans TaxID=2282697 RepID=A0ABW0YM96_9BACI
MLLTKGLESDDVRELQDILKEKGYFTYDESTGHYDQDTEEAVKAYQRDHGLRIDGMAGPETFYALLNGVQPVDPPLPSSKPKVQLQAASSFSVLEPGSEGKMVKSLQKKLKDLGYYKRKISGTFGRSTSEAVRSFQKKQNLTPDGVAGPETFALLRAIHQADHGGEVESDSAAAEPIEEETHYTPVHNFHTELLQLGVKGNGVSRLQNTLKEYGFYSYAVTGIYGERTEKAVKDFQHAVDIEADGIVGEETHEKLAAYEPPKDTGESQAEEIPETDENEIGKELKVGSHGEDVSKLQKALQTLEYIKMEPTGIYSSVTEKAIKLFQREHEELVVDGVAGEKTLSKINKVLKGESEEEVQKKEPNVIPPPSKRLKVVDLIAKASDYLGVPYARGGKDSNGFDGIGFVQCVFNEQGTELPETIEGMWEEGEVIENPTVGDVIFFELNGPGPSQVGIYIGGRQFTYAGSSTGVTIADLDSIYWSERYIGARRYHF